MSNFWPEVKEGRIATKNQMGFMSLEITGASPEFIEHAVEYTDKVVDIGSAYGVVTLPVLERARCQVVALDLSKEHLEILTASVPKEDLNRLLTIHGRFPYDFNFEDNTLDAIHSSYMMHFLTGLEIESGLARCFSVLKPGGKIYINVMSPYFKPFKNILPAYEENVAKGLAWPGEFRDFKKYVIEQDIPHVPNFAHAFKKEALEKGLLQAGFLPEKLFYYDIQEPTWFASEGKGLVAAIAKKP